MDSIFIVFTCAFGSFDILSMVFIRLLRCLFCQSLDTDVEKTPTNFFVLGGERSGIATNRVKSDSVKIALDVKIQKHCPMIRHIGVVYDQNTRVSDAFQEMRSVKIEIDLLGASDKGGNCRYGGMEISVDVQQVAGVNKTPNFGGTVRYGFIRVDAKENVLATILAMQDITRLSNPLTFHFEDQRYDLR
jgi:hypothetical protein